MYAIDIIVSTGDGKVGNREGKGEWGKGEGGGVCEREREREREGRRTIISSAIIAR